MNKGQQMYSLGSYKQITWVKAYMIFFSCWFYFIFSLNIKECAYNLDPFQSKIFTNPST